MKNFCFALTLIAGAGFFAQSTVSAQTVIADLYNDFAQPANTGWSYLWNPSGVTIGDGANYVPIPGTSAVAYNEVADAVSVGTAGGNGNNVNFLQAGGNLVSLRVIGGYDASVAGGDGIDHYAIARYTVQPGEAGDVTFESERINLQANAGNRIEAYKNDVLVDSFALPPNPAEFGAAVSLDFGTCAVGDNLDLAFLTPDNGATRNQRRMFISENFTHHFISTATSTVILGDVDMSGTVDFSDIPSFISVLQTGSFLAEADCNEDLAVDFADIPAFIDILQNQ